jgi:Protein of unknown function (DUF3179)
VWQSVVNGRRLRFRLAGINNQNFIMRDEETGSWWQQVTGRAFAGPMTGAQLTLVPHDEVAFGVWKADHAAGRVLKSDEAVEARDDYAPLDWERRMARTRVVTTLPKGSPFEARALVIGITVRGRSKAYPLEALRQARVITDELHDVPILIVLGEDGRSVRVFDRRPDVAPAFRPAGPTAAARGSAALQFVATPAARLTLVDLETMSEWDFGGRATSGPLGGRTLARLPFLLEYWFDWQTYHPETEVYKPWRPVARPPDRLAIPKP